MLYQYNIGIPRLHCKYNFFFQRLPISTILLECFVFLYKSLPVIFLFQLHLTNGTQNTTADPATASVRMNSPFSGQTVRGAITKQPAPRVTKIGISMFTCDRKYNPRLSSLYYYITCLRGFLKNDRVHLSTIRHNILILFEQKALYINIKEHIKF